MTGDCEWCYWCYWLRSVKLSMWRTRVVPVLVMCLTLAAPIWGQYLRSPNRDIYQNWLGLKYGELRAVPS